MMRTREAVVEIQQLLLSRSPQATRPMPPSPWGPPARAQLSTCSSRPPTLQVVRAHSSSNTNLLLITFFLPKTHCKELGQLSSNSHLELSF